MHELGERQSRIDCQESPVERGLGIVLDLPDLTAQGLEIRVHMLTELDGGDLALVIGVELDRQRTDHLGQVAFRFQRGHHSARTGSQRGRVGVHGFPRNA